MQNSMNLLDEALTIAKFPEWTKRLGLSGQALYNARDRGHLSPAIAGALAEELGKNPNEWIVIAAMESERDSACKTRMLKRLRSHHFSEVTPGRQRPRPSCRWMWSRRHPRDTPSISASVGWSTSPARQSAAASAQRSRGRLGRLPLQR